MTVGSNGARPEISIVILNWNVERLLRDCLRALPAAAGAWWERTEVIVVDNASTDGSVESVRSEFPEVRVLALPDNLGFAAGNNRGIMASRGRYIFLLNPDTVPHAGSIELLAEYLEANDGVGVVGPMLLNVDGSLQHSRRRFPTLPTFFVESTPLQRYFKDARLLTRFYMRDGRDDEVQRVDWLSGAALFCRRETLRQAGVFDPGYFMFSEEVDLQRRISRCGWEIVYNPISEVTHLGGGSTEQNLAARQINFSTGKVRYVRLHEGRLASGILRRYLLALYGTQLVAEAIKLALGHKKDLRRERLRMYRAVLRSGLKEVRRANSLQTGVLFVTGEYPPDQGGVADYTCRLVSALSSAEVKSRVLTQRRGPREMASAPREARGVAPTLLYDKLSVGTVLRAIRGVSPGVIHIQYQTGAFEMRPTINALPALLRVRGRAKVIVTFHDLLVPYLFPKAGRVRGWANRLLARSAAAVIATNPDDEDKLKRWGARRVDLIPIGSNIPCSPPLGYDRVAERLRYGAGPETILLVYFGMLNRSKGVGDLLHALSKLSKEGDYRLLVVGGGKGVSDPTNDRTTSEIRALAELLGVGESIAWTGFLPTEGVSAALLAANIAVLPFADGASFRRGSLLAALEHSLPLITTTPTQAAAVVVEGRPRLRDGENALLVPPGDALALAEAIRTAGADRALRERLSRGASALAQRFDWDEIAERHVSLYRSVGLEGE